MEQSELILDQQNPVITPAVYLKRSSVLLKIYAGEFFIIVLFFLGKIFLETSFLVNLAGAVAGLGLMVLLPISPLGLFFIFKAFRKKESNSTVRLWHLIGHLFAFFVVGLLVLFYIRGAE